MCVVRGGTDFVLEMVSQVVRGRCLWKGECLWFLCVGGIWKTDEVGDEATTSGI